MVLFRYLSIGIFSDWIRCLVLTEGMCCLVCLFLDTVGCIYIVSRACMSVGLRVRVCVCVCVCQCQVVHGPSISVFPVDLYIFCLFMLFAIYPIYFIVFVD